MTTVLIKNGRLIDPSQQLDDTLDVLIENGRILTIAKDIKASADKTINALGQLVVPGFVDMHTHLREPGGEISEDLESGLSAAIAGGFTTVCAMPNTIPACDTPKHVTYLLNRAHELKLANVLPIAAITKARASDEVSPLKALKSAGCCAISDDGCAVSNVKVLQEAMVEAAKLDLLVIEHCEDLKLAQKGVMHKGYWSTYLGLKGISSESESIIVDRDIQMAAQTGVRLHIAHVSTAESVSLIRQAKHKGMAVTCEVTPHHFSLTDEAVKTFDTSTKVNPPLRSKKDVLAIKEGLSDGTIDVIATDHAPHALIYKQRTFNQAAFGMIGLETALPLSMRLIDEGVLNWSSLIDKLTYQPARILKYDRGTLKPGSLADVTIIDSKKKWVYLKDKIQSKSSNSPFINQTFMGKVAHTIVSGRVFSQ
jgi:dihydroorotase